MSKNKHNYTQYSDKNRNNVDNQKPKHNFTVAESHPDPIGEPGTMGVPGIELVHETVDTKPVPTTVAGMVVGCARLNVRAEASLFADVVCVLNAQSEIEIDVNKSDKDWFYVCTATGIEGYCMRKFVEAHL